MRDTTQDHPTGKHPSIAHSQSSDFSSELPAESSEDLKRDDRSQTVQNHRNSVEVNVLYGPSTEAGSQLTSATDRLEYALSLEVGKHPCRIRQRGNSTSSCTTLYELWSFWKYIVNISSTTLPLPSVPLIDRRMRPKQEFSFDIERRLPGAVLNSLVPMTLVRVGRGIQDVKLICENECPRTDAGQQEVCRRSASQEQDGVT